MQKKSELTNSVDEHVGRRVQWRRAILGLTQKDLADKCGVSFQQIQKYESGDNSMSASRLFVIGTAMQTPVSFFFTGLPGNYPDENKTTRSMHVSDIMSADDPLGKRESLDLIEAFWHLPSDKDRAAVWNLIRELYERAEIKN